MKSSQARRIASLAANPFPSSRLLPNCFSYDVIAQSEKSEGAGIPQPMLCSADSLS